MASENQEALSDWLKYASPEGIYYNNHASISCRPLHDIDQSLLPTEQHTVLKMLKSAEATQVNDVSTRLKFKMYITEPYCDHTYFMCRQSARLCSQEQLKPCIAGYRMLMIKVRDLFTALPGSFTQIMSIFSMQNVMLLFVCLVP